MSHEESIIEQTLSSWSSAVESGDLDSVLTHYHPDAVLWGTISEDIRVNTSDIRHYFEHFCPKVTGETQWNQVYIQDMTDFVVASGHYTFVLDGNDTLARYSITLVPRNEGDYSDWVYLHHHSSTQPENPLGLPAS